jgi:exosortase O
MTKTKANYLKSCLILLATLLYYRGGFAYLWKVLSSKQYYESNFLFIILIGFILGFIFKHRDQLKPQKNITAFWLLIGCVVAYFLNGAVFYFGLLKGILAITSLYALIGLHFDTELWKRLFFLVVILICTLPFLDAMQRFLGFPLRILTAQVVSFLIGMLGFANINQSTVILTENNVTSIDIPCSGVKSLYIGFLFLLAFFYIKNIRLNKKSVLVGILFFILLTIVNIWRVFSLIFVHDILNMTSLADRVHVGLGLLGFILSCLSLIYLSKKYLSVRAKKNKKSTKTNHIANHCWIFQPLERIANKNVIILVLASFTIINSIFANNKSYNPTSLTSEFSLNFSDTYEIVKVPFSQVEKNYFIKNKMRYYQKYNGILNGKPFTLMVLTTASARGHHDPQVCLQGAGNQVLDQELVNFANQPARHLILSQDNHAYYYFIDTQGLVLADVSQRVWNDLKNPDKLWTLVILAFGDTLNCNDPQLIQLIKEVNQQAIKLNQL